MIVFKNHKEEYRTLDWIERINVCLNRLLHNQNGHDLTVNLLIETGELECAITDHFCTEEDVNNQIINSFRELSNIAGNVFYTSWKNNCIDQLMVCEFINKFDSIKSFELPEKFLFGVSEGFAFYGLFPETYIHSSEKFYLHNNNRPVVIIGLRTIGTILSTIVSTVLKKRGCDVISFTLRPRGQPFDRQIKISKKLEQKILLHKSDNFIITDEGPGLSGSSFGGTAALLSSLGVRDKNIIFFPSWDPDSKVLNSPNARYHWDSHTKYCSSFESSWIESKRLQNEFNADSLVDISAGHWRKWLLKGNNEGLAIHPQHERRKYLVSKRGSTSKTPSSIIKFAGLGRYGEYAYKRSSLLEKSGFIPKLYSFKNGFLEYELIINNTNNKINKQFLAEAAGYVSYLKNHFTAKVNVYKEQLLEMVHINICESIGPHYLIFLKDLYNYLDHDYEKNICEVDGRMDFYKWVKLGDTYLKTDHTDHHNDQFFPGCQDSAWDIVGGIIEWNLDDKKEKYFIDMYIEKSRDTLIGKRIKSNKIVYCSFKIGLSKLFKESLAELPEGCQFEKKYNYYKNYLINILK
jgi:hypothetical protein